MSPRQTTLTAQPEGETVPYDPNIMDDPCRPKCGAIDQYTPDTMTKMRPAMGNSIEKNMMVVMTGEMPSNTTPDLLSVRYGPKIWSRYASACGPRQI